MSKHFIPNVPRYFEDYVNDCFSNSISSLLTFQNINAEIVFTDYISFIYEGDTGFIGANYLYRPLVVSYSTEEECNTSCEMIYMPQVTKYACRDTLKLKNDKINIIRYIEEDYNVAYSRLKELIDNDIPTIVSVDLFYMHYHGAFNKKHGFHNIVITGYDEDENYYEAFDKFKLSKSNFDGKISMDEIKLGRTSVSENGNPLTGMDAKRPINCSWIEILVGDRFKMNDSTKLNIIRESCKRMLGEEKILNQDCGLKVLDRFKQDLLLKKEAEFDDKTTYYFKTYLNEFLKRLGRNRKRFKKFICELDHILEKETINKLAVDLSEAAMNWDICANLSYKLGVTKKIEIIDNMCNIIDEIIRIEKDIANKLKERI